jgi:hypothetical protein
MEVSMVSSPMSPREPQKKRTREEDDYRGIEDLDRAELDDEIESHDEEPSPAREDGGESDGEDWLNETGVRRNPSKTPAPRVAPARAIG